jgi:hypothetical protein
MTHHQCLNCGQQLSGNYCQHCGQKASTHRFTLSHVFTHDVVHGLIHVDKGILYTIKQLLTRPGYSIREYIEGKRTSHFSYVTLLLLLIATVVFISMSGGINFGNMLAGAGTTSESGAKVVSGVWHFMLKHMKELSLLSVLAYSIASFLVFRKARQNFAEHMVMNCYRECGVMIINILLMSSFLIPMGTQARAFTSMIAVLLMYIYNYKFYLQYFKPDYNNKFYLAFLVMWSQTVMVLVVCCIMILAAITMVASGMVQLEKSKTGGFNIIQTTNHNSR